VPIVAAAGRLIPKTSSRAITSPAGTADAMETMAPVDLSHEQVVRVVESEGGCIAWGGRLGLSPADDVLISVERPLDIDALGQLVASVLSKKAAAGATDVLIDIPVGPTAKIRSDGTFTRLSQILVDVGAAIGLRVRPLRSDGRQPVGRGIGPSLEARDALAVLRNDAAAPPDLRERALDLAGAVLELDPTIPGGTGRALAQRHLDDGSALAKLEAICEKQGGRREPGVAPLQHPVEATSGGRVTAIDNRRLARAAKLAGAPRAATAGAELHVRLGREVRPGEPVYTLHAQTPGQLRQALAYVAGASDIVSIDEDS
jgi:thymidine phosphorylase